MRYFYGVLGTARALREDGTAVPLGGARVRALLTALAVAGGRTVRPEALAAEVWARTDEPPADEPAALQALVGRLRKALGRDAVASGHGGYRLAADRDAVDLFRFERLAGAGARSLADGDAEGAASLLDEALALWRGPALVDLPGAAGSSVAVRVAARRVAARRDRLAAALALGEEGTALPELRALASEHPLDEPLQALHVRALRDAGRTAEALSAYEEVRAALADRLGTDPGRELRTLHAELLRPAPRPPGEREGAVAAGTRPGNLRARLTSFVGRENDMEALRGDLGGARLVTLLGPGGSGKTRLAVEAADSVAERWPDGVWLAELAPVRDPETVPEAVLTALGGRETRLWGSGAEGLRASADPSAQLAERCANRRMLLVLDNCEHLLAAAAHLVEKLLLACPQVTVLATSREPLGVPGESVRPVEPLPAPTALRLLDERGAAARPGFRAQSDPEACAEICRRLDGLPLAIELAAARLRSLTPRALADRLDDRFRLLTGGSRTVLPRQQTLRAVVDWSWELLAESERTVLRRMAVFSGGCELEQAEAVCTSAPDTGAGGAGRPESAPGRADVAAVLGSLVDKSLVVAVPLPGGTRMRYALLETVAEYAAERLDEAGERDGAERRHLTAYRELARTTDPLLRGPGQRHHLDRLEQEHDNLRTALRRALAGGDEHEALCLTLSLYWFWELRGHRSDLAAWSGAVSALGPAPFRPPVRLAPDLALRCAELPPPFPADQLAEARRQTWIIHFAAREPDMTLIGSPDMQEQLRVLAQTYRPGQPQVCRPPGLLWFYAVVLLGGQDRLAEILDAAVHGSRESGTPWELAMALQMRAKMFNEGPGAVTAALADADEALDLFTRIGDLWGVAEALAGRGDARERRNDLTGAAEDYRRGIGLAEELGAQGQVPLLRARLAGVRLEHGGSVREQEEAEALLHEALREAERTGSDTMHYARVHLAMRLGGTGRVPEARAHLEALRERFFDMAPPMFLGLVDGLDGWLYIREGRADQAVRMMRRAIAEAQRDSLTRTVAPRLVVSQLATSAEALAGAGRAADAARLLGAYDQHDEVFGAGAAGTRDSRAAAERLARTELGEEGYARVYAEGCGLSVEEAAALV